MTCEIMLTVAMGKRLIARGLMADGQVQDAMRNHKLLIIGGSTNGYVAEEALRALGDGRAFDKRGFRRASRLRRARICRPSPAASIC